jgi:flagellin
MSLSINTNIGSLNASAAASSVNRSMETSMNRLSTGLRINAARDDAAGVAIASRLTAEIRGTNQAIRNASDGQALADTAEGALVEVVNILQRMRELAVQASNDTNDGDNDRAALDLEYQALNTELDRIEGSTTWAGQKLLDGTGGDGSGMFSLMVGTGAAATVATDVIEHTFADITTMKGTIGDITDLANATAEIEAVDTAINAVNLERAGIGALSNRLESTISNLTNISVNLEAGRSRIQDADFAAESTNMAKSQILQQASTAMLAQANASKQGVLQLLQG